MYASNDIKFRFNPSSSKSKKVLGPLEGEIMDVVWQHGPTTVSAVHKALREHKEIAYTTVMTTMSRLAKKHLLSQDRSASSYVYTPALDRPDFERYVISGVVAALLDDYGDAAIDGFVSLVNDRGGESAKRLRDAFCE